MAAINVPPTPMTVYLVQLCDGHCRLIVAPVVTSAYRYANRNWPSQVADVRVFDPSQSVHR